MANDNSGLIVSALEKTDPALAQRIDAQNSWKSLLIKSGARTKLFREYERGDHRAKVTTQMMAMLRITAGDDAMNDFAINQCEAVVGKEAALIFVSSITVDDAAKDWLAETLERNKFDARQVEDTSGALRDGNAYTMIGTDAIWTSEPAYDGYSGVTVIYSSFTRRPIWACKLWSESAMDIEEDDAADAIMRVVVYQLDKISFFTGEVNGQEVAQGDSKEDKAWGLDFIPIVPYVNRSKNYTKAGQSELRNIISLQDMLNRVCHSMISAVEQGGFPLRWSIGMEMDLEDFVPGGVQNLIPKNADGTDKTEWKENDIAFLNAIKTGQYDAIDIPPFLEVLTSLVQHIGYVSQTPLLGVTISGGLSGDALRQLNAGLISKALRYTQGNTDAYKQLIQMTADIQNKFDTGLGSAPELGAISINWKDVEILNVNDRLDALGRLNEKMPNKLSNEFLLTESLSLIGYGQEKIDEEIEKANDREGLLFDRLTNADGSAPAVNVGGALTEQSPENIASDKGLNGAQIKAASDLFASMSAGTIASGVVVELLVSLGIDKALAESMVAEQNKIKLAEEDAPITA